MSTLKTNEIQTVSGKPILNSTGSILQVVQTVNTTEYSTTSATLTNTGFTASITPSSSSNKILISYTSMGYNPSAGSGVFHAIAYGGTFIARQYVSYDSAGGNLGSAAIIYLHSPATTSSCTYTIQIAVSGAGTAYLYGSYPSYITLMEVSG